MRVVLTGLVGASKEHLDQCGPIHILVADHQRTQRQGVPVVDAHRRKTLLIVLDIWNVISAIRASGIATLIVDRDYRKVLPQSDRALVRQKGQVVLQGTSDEVADSAALAGYLCGYF